LLDDEELALDARDRAARVRRDFRDGGIVCRGLVHRFDADRANAVSAVTQQKPKVILFGDMSYTRLLFAKPSFGGKMLEEGMNALAPFVLALGRRQTARNRLGPVGSVGKARPAVGRLFERADLLLFKYDLRLSKRHRKLQFTRTNI
jgi:hypothetical protein